MVDCGSSSRMPMLSTPPKQAMLCADPMVLITSGTLVFTVNPRQLRVGHDVRDTVYVVRNVVGDERQQRHARQAERVELHLDDVLEEVLDTNDADLGSGLQREVERELAVGDVRALELGPGVEHEVLVGDAPSSSTTEPITSFLWASPARALGTINTVRRRAILAISQADLAVEQLLKLESGHTTLHGFYAYVCVCVCMCKRFLQVFVDYAKVRSLFETIGRICPRAMCGGCKNFWKLLLVRAPPVSVLLGDGFFLHPPHDGVSRGGLARLAAAELALCVAG